MCGDLMRFFNKKAQGLPMTTIALLILVIIVLVGVAIFFFTGFAGGQEGIDESIMLSHCQDLCARVAAGAKDYCNNAAGWGDDGACIPYMHCAAC